MILHRVIFVVALVGFMAMAGPAGCDREPLVSADIPPLDHTVSLEGADHMPGLDDPVANCRDCHGSELRGGENGEPSCFVCHGPVW